RRLYRCGRLYLLDRGCRVKARRIPSRATDDGRDKNRGSKSGMNPYDILGIRPNAGREEIELAYKGRRSQYHPDRYGQSDAQTQAWATGKMQELNQAYATLKDPEERDRFDNARTNRASQAEPPPQAAPRSRASLR